MNEETHKVLVDMIERLERKVNELTQENAALKHELNSRTPRVLACGCRNGWCDCYG